MARRKIWIDHIRGTLSSGITATSGTLTSTDGNPGLAGLDGNLATSTFIVGSVDPFGTGGDPEQVVVTSATAGTITIGERGYGGTTARAHDAGTTIVFPVTAEDIAAKHPLEVPLWGDDVIYQYYFNADVASGSTLSDGWSWLNQGGSAYEERDGAGIFTLPSDGSFDYRGIYKSLTLATSYYVEGLFGATQQDANYYRLGLAITDGTFGHFVGFDDDALNYGDWSGPTTDTGAVQIAWNPSTPQMAARMTRNASDDWDIQWSYGGRGFTEMVAARAIETEMGGTADAVGFVGENRVGSTVMTVECRAIRVVDLT